MVDSNANLARRMYRERFPMRRLPNVQVFIVEEERVGCWVRRGGWRNEVMPPLRPFPNVTPNLPSVRGLHTVAGQQCIMARRYDSTRH
ncbi:hypothetical protein EVAR_22402_1 [Eumeta japonica]|uniref:Uncharacterized protein n=1 Tax=Eumeta variegata TaxID=151549 RepID=A0A4C1VJJ6_EUMVA|nr:hypothetical protein EVAR_22402_1 [Eumeta japonica]